MTPVNIQVSRSKVKPILNKLGEGSGPQFLVHTGTVHGGFAVLLRTSCYEFVVMIPYCIKMLDMKYACCRVDMCCVG